MSAVPAARDEAVPLGDLIARLVRGTERGGRHWTVARRKDSLARVLSGNRNDAQRLQQRLAQLVKSWEDDATGAQVEVAITTPAPLETPAGARADVQAWSRVAGCFGDALDAALSVDEARARALVAELRTLRGALESNGAVAPLVERAEAWGERARRLLAHRQHLLDQMGALTEELAAGMVELAEDDSWARGQAEAMRRQMRDGPSASGVRSVSHLLAATRERQHALRAERAAAREALKAALQTMLQEVGELGSHTDRFDDQLGRYADVIQRTDSLESLAGAMQEMVDSSRGVRSLVRQTRERLHEEHERAGALAARVERLEAELKQLSDVVSTDPLTGAANRRGLHSAYAAECARAERSGAPLAIGLIDLDDFKRLNDSLGHAVGDRALVALAARARDSLRPTDTLARFGGEEFVVLLPGCDTARAQSTLTRLQRCLSAALFLHDERPVLVTFSAGVTAVRPGERLEDALERADEALYEAKRTGKNRSCVA